MIQKSFVLVVVFASLAFLSFAQGQTPTQAKPSPQMNQSGNQGNSTRQSGRLGRLSKQNTQTDDGGAAQSSSGRLGGSSRFDRGKTADEKGSTSGETQDATDPAAILAGPQGGQEEAAERDAKKNAGDQKERGATKGMPKSIGGANRQGAGATPAAGAGSSAIRVGNPGQPSGPGAAPGAAPGDGIGILGGTPGAPGAPAGQAGGGLANLLNGLTGGQQRGGTGPGAAGAGVTGGTGPGGVGQGVRIQGQGVFDPVKDKKLTYTELPDEGEKMSGLDGPKTAIELLTDIKDATGWNIIASEKVKTSPLQFWINEVTPKQAMEVLKFNDIYYEYNKETKFLYVMDKEEYLMKEFGDLIQEEFIVKNASIEYLESVLATLMSPRGRIITDPRTQHIFVWDTQDNVTEMRKKFDMLDVPLEQAEFTVRHGEFADIETVISSLLSPSGRLVTDPRQNRIMLWDIPGNIVKMKEAVEKIDVPLSREEFQIKFADVTDMEAVISSLLSPTGRTIADPRTGQVMVWDTSENLAKMREAVERLDVPLQSKVIHLKYVDAENIVDSLQDLLTERGTIQPDPRANNLVVTDVPTRQNQIEEMVAMLDKKLDTKTWTLNYLEAEDIQERLESVVPEEMGSIIVDENVHQITVTAVPERLEEVDGLIKQWDVKRKQVHIQAYLITTTNTFARELNIKWSYFNMAGHSPYALHFNGGNTKPDLTDSSNPLSVGQLPWSKPDKDFFTQTNRQNISGKEVINDLRGSNISAALTYLDSRGDVNILASPSVTVQDGEEAAFENSSQVPYVTSTAYGAGSSNYGRSSSTLGRTGSNANTANSNINNSNYNNQYGSAYGSQSAYYYGGYQTQPYNRIDFIEVGTILRVLPRITEDGTILLDVSAEDSSYKDKLVQANDQQNSVPEKTQSKAETQVRVIDGQTVVLGGLKRSENTDKKSSTPFLGDIPGIGLLFRNPSHKFQKSNLMIFITTSIVDETTRSETEKLLAESDNIMGKQFRKAKKSNWGRLVDTLTANQREIGVSIGQSGQMYSNGKKVTLDELRDLFKTMAAPETRTLVIRRHETAPKKIVEDVETAAREVGLRVEYDDSLEVMTAAPASASAPADAANPLENPLAPAPATASAPVDVVQTDAQVKRDAEKASEPAKQ